MTTWNRTTIPAIANALIARCEGVRLAAYKDSTGRCTIGIGSLHMPSGRAVQMGDRINVQDAWDLLDDHCEAQVLPGLLRAVSVPLSDVQAAVLVDFAYNLGSGALAGSTLARMIAAGDMPGAGRQLLGWAVAGGAPQLGLLRRREYERRLWTGEAVEGLDAYNAVWRLGLGDLMPGYQRAFIEARAFGWQGSSAPIATPLHTGSGLATRPVAVVSAQQSAADALNEAQLATIKGA